MDDEDLVFNLSEIAFYRQNRWVASPPYSIIYTSSLIYLFDAYVGVRPLSKRFRYRDIVLQWSRFARLMKTH